MHRIPGTKRDQAYESDQHANVETKVDFEASVIAPSVPSLDDKTHIVGRVIAFRAIIVIHVEIVYCVLAQ